jgi:hypothetical protein
MARALLTETMFQVLVGHLYKFLIHSLVFLFLSKVLSMLLRHAFPSL